MSQEQLSRGGLRGIWNAPRVRCARCHRWFVLVCVRTSVSLVCCFVDDRADSLFMSVERGEGEALPLVLPEELALLQADVVHLIGRAAAVGALPLVGRAAPPLPGEKRRDGKLIDS